MKLYVVVTTEKDKALLEMLLHEERRFADIIFAVGQSQSATISLASSLLMVRQQPVILVADVESHAAVDIQETQRIVNNVLFSATTANTPYKILLAVPELEILLTFDKTVLEHLMSQTIADTEYQLAQVTPRKFLSGGSSPQWEIAPLLTKLTQADITRIRQHPLMHELLAFVAEVTARVGE